MSEPKPSAKSVLVTSFALVALWAGSWALSYADLGRWHLTTALVIAVTKAALVALVFMELLHVRATVRLAAAAAVLMVGLLIGLVVMDVAARGAG
jgi:cytochrome c oxidase subunit 4